MSYLLERAIKRVARLLNPPRRPETPTLQTVRFRGARFKVWANQDVGWRIIEQGSYEPFELDALLSFVRPDDVCLDIGANIGIFTVFLGRAASRGHVYAFEPLEANANLLRANAEINGVRNYTLRSEIASDVDGEVEFTVAEDAAYSSLRDTGRKAVSQVVRVPSTRLDTFVARAAIRPSILKMDVEGAELLVLRGAVSLLASPDAPRAILAEAVAQNCAPYGYTPADLIEFLQGFGYAPHAIHPRRGIVPYPCEGAAEEILFVRRQEERAD